MRSCLIYEDDPPPFSGRPTPYNELPATMFWRTHFANSMELKFFLNHGDRWEKQRASSELSKCERKMTYWERHPNWDKVEALREAGRIKRMWGEG